MRPQKIFLFIFSLIALGIACSTFSGSNADTPSSTGDNPNSEENSASTPTATYTPQPEESTEDSEELPPLDFIELLDAGVEAGNWTQEEGLVLFLKYFTGEVTEDHLPGISDVVLKSGSGIVRLANEHLALPDADSETRAELERLLRKLFPPQAVVDKISQPADETSESSSFKLASLANPSFVNQNEEEVCVDWIQRGNPEEITEGTTCLLFRDRVITDTTTVKIFFPAWTEDREEILSTVSLLLDTLEETAVTYDLFDGLEIHKFNLFYWPGNWWNDARPDFTGIQLEGENTCNITRNNSGYTISEQDQQQLAMEMFACVYQWSFEDNHMLMYPSTLYFSNVVYPHADVEWETLPYFDRRSTTIPIYRMGFDGFVFFQFLGNVYGHQTVVDIMSEMNADITNLIPNIAPGLPGDFNRFVVDYLSVGIADENTGNYFLSPSPPQVTDTIMVDEVGEYILEAEFLTARRYFVDYQEQKRFLQVQADSDYQVLTAVKADLHWTRDAWSGVPPEIRSECDQNVRYLYVPTWIGSEDPGEDNAIRVTTAEQAVCDPCLLGAWKVDNASFSDFMNTIFKENVPQAGNFQTVIQGNYYLQFDTEGKIQTQREGLTAYIYLESEFSVMPTLDPTNPGPQPTTTPYSLPVYTGVEINSSGIGNYSADGDYMRVTQFVDVVEGVNTTPTIVQSSPGGFLWIPTDGEFEYTSAFNSNREPGSTEDVVYVCEGDILDITMNETGTDLLLTRVEKILPTPVPTQYVPTEQPDE